MASESDVDAASEHLQGGKDQSAELIEQGLEKLDVAGSGGIRTSGEDPGEDAADGETLGPLGDVSALYVDETLGSSNQPVAAENRLPGPRAAVSEGLMKAIRSKSLWQDKLRDETIVKKYRREAIDQGMPAEVFEETMKHLQFEAKNTGVSGVTLKASTSSPSKQMKAISTSEMNDLIESVAALQSKVPMILKELLEEDCGVWHVDNIIPEKLREIIETRLDAIADLPEKDFHPNSNNQVQDLIHPSLFPYIENISPVIDKAALPSKSITSSWGRRYEDSKYQWLPAQFHVDTSGSVQIRTYINNLEESTNGELYRAIELVFGLFLPMFEKLLWPRNLRGRELQVIVKAANYVIQPHGNVYEGEWHVEGMSHEHIVASGIYYYSTSPWLKDGGLEFRRERDVDYDFPEISKYNADMYDDIEDPSEEDKEMMEKLSQDFQENIFLGAVSTVPNRLLVFSNELQHKVSKIVNESDQVATRKILVFFLVDPEIEIVSTKHVPEQKREEKFPELLSVIRRAVAKACGNCLPYDIERGMTLAEAKWLRLKLMEERAIKVRQDNSHWEREYSLCEH